MHRREAIKLTAFGMVVAGNVAMLEGCTAGDTVMNILGLLQPGIDGVLPIVALVDPALGPALGIAITVFDAAVATVKSLYANYEAALKANGGNAPSLLQQFKAGLSALNTDVIQILGLAHVKDVAHATIIGELISAVTTEISQILSIFSPPAVNVSRTFSSQGVTVTTMPTKAQIKSEHAAFKARMHAILSRVTGDSALDAQCAKLAVSYR